MPDDSDGDTDYGVDSSPWAAHREQLDKARTTARLRYRDYLTKLFAQHGVTDPGRLADVTLDALTVWRRSSSGEQCRCSCHLQLPHSDLHDYGLNCTCTQSEDERRRVIEEWRSDIEEFWSSPAGQRIVADERAADAEFDSWLAAQQGVTVSRHGGFAPESWAGHIDGHSFMFRERFGQWGIEIDLQPSGRFVQEMTGTNRDGVTTYRPRELDAGRYIASGTIDDPDYGTTTVERAQFIVETIRTYLSREACAYHLEPRASLDAVLGIPARWCPVCGKRLHGR